MRGGWEKGYGPATQSCVDAKQKMEPKQSRDYIGFDKDDIRNGLGFHDGHDDDDDDDDLFYFILFFFLSLLPLFLSRILIFYFHIHMHFK